MIAPGRRTASERTGIEVVAASRALGAEVLGVDLSRPLDAATLPAVLGAWRRHLVLLFREQKISDGDLVAFSRRFGELEIPPLFQGRRFVEEHPEIMIVSNVVESGRPLGALGNAESFWHSDLNFTEAPPAAVVLHAREMPGEGGDTEFANLVGAWAALPEELKARVEGRRIRHDARYNSAGYLRETRAPDAWHPIGCTHPATGQKLLYLGRRMNAEVEGLDARESGALLDALWAHAVGERFVWRHRWRVGDVVVWDNVAVMHRRDALDPGARRTLQRTQVKGARLS